MILSLTLDKPAPVRDRAGLWQEMVDAIGQAETEAIANEVLGRGGSDEMLAAEFDAQLDALGE